MAPNAAGVTPDSARPRTPGRTRGGTRAGAGGGAGGGGILGGMAVTARRANPDDAAELTRLRVVMFEAMGLDISAADEPWRQRTTVQFRERLRDTASFAAFVVGKPGGAGLAACAAGWLNPHLIGPA